MTIKCTTHSQNDAKAVCHHCGQPLCNLTNLPLPRGITIKKDQLCGYIINDPAFAVSDGAWVAACHCENCLKEQHPSMVSHMERMRAGL